MISREQKKKSELEEEKILAATQIFGTRPEKNFILEARSRE